MKPTACIVMIVGLPVFFIEDRLHLNFHAAKQDMPIPVQ